jgi:hypothetical protein
MIEGKGQERGLDHEDVVDGAFREEVGAEEGGFVGRRAEDVQKLRAAQVEHELGIN